MMKYLDKPKFNLLGILLFTIIGSAFMMTSNFTEKSAGMATLFIMWIPAVIGIGTMIFYGLSRLMFKKFNWILSIIGIIIGLYSGISFHYIG